MATVSDQTSNTGKPSTRSKPPRSPGRLTEHAPSLEEWRTQPLEKHIDSLRYTASLIGALIGRDLLRCLQKGGKKDVGYVRNQSISFGIMTDKASQGESNQGLHITLPATLTQGLQVLIAARVVGPPSGTPLALEGGGDRLGTGDACGGLDSRGPARQYLPKELDFPTDFSQIDKQAVPLEANTDGGGVCHPLEPVS